MPAKDYAHDSVKRALIKDGWVVTAEQVRLLAGERYLWIDVKAEQPQISFIILVEVKSFNDTQSPAESLANAVGKYLMYRVALRKSGSTLPLYLAVPSAAYQGILSEELGQSVLHEAAIKLIVVDTEREEIVEWIH